MLKADIATSDLSLRPSWNDGKILFGRSYIAPHATHLLETLLVLTEGQWFAVIRERRASKDVHTGDFGATIIDTDDEHFARIYRECLNWPLDYLIVEVAQEGCRTRLRSGPLGLAPVYYKATRDHLALSWDFCDLIGTDATIDLEITSHLLALDTFYSSRQVCAGINLLTERSQVYIEPRKLVHQYPQAAEALSPLEKIDDAPAIFQEILQRTLSIRPLTAENIVVELSGGLDSTTVATAAAAMYGAVASKGILLDGAIGQAQIERRGKIISISGLMDQTIHIGDFPPNLDLSPTAGGFHKPPSEYYLEAFEELWLTARNEGRLVLLTGIGGDELFPFYENELPLDALGSPIATTGVRYYTSAQHHAAKILTPRARNASRTLRTFDAPPAPVTMSSLLASACQAPHLLRHGLWPINPLSDPALIAFCHRLPASERHHRALMRKTLASRLGHDLFPPEYVKETFSDVFPRLISQQESSIAGQLKECALADLGLVDQRAALGLLATVAAQRDETAVAALVAFLWIERFVRRIA